MTVEVSKKSYNELDITHGNADLKCKNSRFLKFVVIMMQQLTQETCNKVYAFMVWYIIYSQAYTTHILLMHSIMFLRNM